jgi:hypothetical protein
MARFKVVLTVINEDSVTPFVVGPRFRRAGRMPMEHLAEERRGYWFSPEELDLAQECADQFTKYIKDADQKKKKK